MMMKQRDERREKKSKEAQTRLSVLVARQRILHLSD